MDRRELKTRRINSFCTFSIQENFFKCKRERANSFFFVPAKNFYLTAAQFVVFFIKLVHKMM